MKTTKTIITITLDGPKKDRLIFSSVLRGFLNTCVGFCMPARVNICVQQEESK